MPMTVLCPTCNAILQTADSSVGTTVSCPKCAAEMLIPPPLDSAPDSPTPATYDVPPPNSYPIPKLAKSVHRPPAPPPTYHPAEDRDDDDEPRPSRRRSKRSRRDDDEDDDDAYGERRPSRRGARCRCCDSKLYPVRREQISQGGWIVFAVMLLVCWPLFFIGLLMKEEYMACADCGARLNA